MFQGKAFAILQEIINGGIGLTKYQQLFDTQDPNSS